MPRLLFVLTLLSSPLLAQEYGHMNFANVLARMPGTAMADTTLVRYSDSLTVVGEGMVGELREKYLQLQSEVNNLPPVQLRERRAELEADQNRIAVFENRMGQLIEVKRQELLGPLIQELRAAIEKVAEERGLIMVFNTSLFNAVLFAEDMLDITPLVEAELGL